MFRNLLRVVLVLILAPPVLIFALALLMIPGNRSVGVAGNPADSPLRYAPPPAWTAPLEIKVLTFNIQDLLVVASDHENRMRYIARKLNELDPDIAGFQEAFVEDHRAILINSLKQQTRLQHFQYYASGTMGSGVLIASAYPIEEVYFQRYTDSNPLWKLWEGDWWAGKGAGLARIALPEGRYLDFYNTHAQAGYGNPYYDVVRTNQMSEFARFIVASHAATIPALVVGDLNCRKTDPDCQALYSGASLVPVTNMETGIDQILTMEDRAYAVEIVETIQINKRSVVDGVEVTLTDHNGYLSTLRISPVATAQSSQVDSPPATL